MADTAENVPQDLVLDNAKLTQLRKRGSASASRTDLQQSKANGNAQDELMLSMHDIPPVDQGKPDSPV